MLKPLSALLTLIILHTCVRAQHMQVRENNYTSFSTDRKFVPEALEQYSSSESKQHPEYGILPAHAQCIECVEIIDKRTINSRHYIDPKQPGRSFSQRSYFPLHYKRSADDIWHSIDERLRATNTPGVFIADRQPVITKSDINRKSTSLISQGVEFEFNKNVSMYFVDGNNAQSAIAQSDYSNYTAGDDGVYIKDVWNGVDMEQSFDLGEIKTTYVINAAIDIPIQNGYMVIEDRFTLPAGITISETTDGHHTIEGYYQGDYLIKNTQGEVLFKYQKPALYDAKIWGIIGSYQLISNGNNYTLKLLIPVSWLRLPENEYPLYIDPTVSGTLKRGDFWNTTGGFPENFAFTTMALGSCDYYMTVPVPAKSRLTNSFVDLEYRLTYDPMCGTPPLPAPFCTFSQVSMEIRSDDCNTSSGLLACNPAQPPFTGTCTTDPTLVAGAGPIQINSFQPNFLTCIPPSCDSLYFLDFTLKNRDSTCGAACSYLCANGTMWQMTIEACRVEGTVTQNKTLICPGELVTYTAVPNCGVPPYTYRWTNSVDNTTDTTTTPTYTFTSQTPNSFFDVYLVIVDACGVVTPVINTTLVDVNSAPDADAGPDQTTCLGGAVQLGGSPTTSPGASITWLGQNSTVQSWLTSNSFPNPTANIPAGTVDTFYYVVRTSNGGTCIRYDTVYVFSNDGPVADAGTDLNLCGGGTATIGGTPSATAGFNIEWAGYGNTDANNWLNGSNTANPTINIPAGMVDTLYYLIQVFNNQCSRRDTMAVFLPQPPLANAGTDVSLCEGGTATLGGTPAAGPGTTVAWSSNDATAATWLSSTTAPNPQIVVPAGTTGSYQYYLTVTDPNCSRIDTVRVSSAPIPVAVVDTSGPTLICSNTSVILSVAGTYTSYLWNNGATTQSTTISSAGSYFVIVSDANGCTDTSDVITVTTIAAPTVTVFPDTAINYGDSLSLYTDINLATMDSFMWYPGVNISCLNCANPTVAPEQDTYYGIYVYANGCPAIDSALIRIILKNNYYLPNAFTPNGDGNNDDFYILTQKGVRVLEFQIFNRIGEKIHDGLYPWNGTYKGAPCQPGTYVYQVRMGLFGEDQGIFRKGSVTLIR